MVAYKQAVAQAVPNSSGTNPPRTRAPVNAADCHIHIYDPRFEPRVDRVTNATVSDYRLLQKRIGLSRVVIVQPRNYGVDNTPTLDAIQQLGSDNARGVGVLRPDVTEDALDRLHAGGIRGIRFTVGDPATAVVSVDMIEPLAKRIARLGWHIQLNMPVDEIVSNARMLAGLPVQVVFDHLGHVPSTDHPGWGVVQDLLQKARAWVKISGAYMNSDIGPPDYPEATRIAQAYVKAAPERCVWGSDWPHPSPKVKPDDANLFDLLAVWAPDEPTRNRILVANPEALYGFAKTTM
ncbi:MAG: 2-pyrone-4,6-dicarboxylate hydrolase [Betaproteobacteria bacterium]|nr:MAG: 2-pyrone-4,6-dicarboxylate hydrolase [Betaproteobacteria bacterium]